MFDTRHLFIETEGLLSDSLAKQENLATDRVRELIAFGSVYLNHERQCEDIHVPAGSYVRMHCLPKRYPVETVDWKSRIAYETEDFLIVNKPKGIPVHATVDNAVENVTTQLSLTLGQGLYVTQRLDVPTQGLFLIAKERSYQSLFNKSLREKRVTKHYTTFVDKPVEKNRYTHYMQPSIKAPKVMKESPEVGWLECHLEVLKCSAAQEKHRLEIHLITGRTHQIRAQLATLGSPIIGDVDYGGRGTLEDFNLICHRLIFYCPKARAELSFHLRDFDA